MSIILASLGDLSQEFFSLDLSKLESSIMTIPFHDQIGLDSKEIEPSYLEQILQRSGNVKKEQVVDSVTVEKELTQNMLNILNFKLTNATTDVEKRDSNHDSTQVIKGESLPSEKTSAVGSVSAPLEQRIKRRQRVNNSIGTSETPVDTSEKDDLKFIEDLDKESKPTDKQIDQCQESKVVAVKLKSDETQNLEDWLDDFLDD